MKNIIYLSLITLLIVSCKNETKTDDLAYSSFGDKITADGSISKEALLEKYQSMKPTDTLNVKVASKIIDVCQKKGCWMNIDLGNNKSTFVKFKDYAFFMPFNASGSEVIVEGKAFISVDSVEDLKEYAKDAGESQAAIDSITKPETNYSFMANGVLIKN